MRLNHNIKLRRNKSVVTSISTLAIIIIIFLLSAVKTKNAYSVFF